MKRGLLDVGPASGRTLQLYSTEYVPTELRRPWILGGYRACPLPLGACFLSALRPTNELLNVWTHVIALAMFARRLLAGRGFGGSAEDRATEALLLVMAQTCFLLSATFHLLNTWSLRAYRLLHKADVAGIVCLVAACYGAALQLGFRCAPSWARMYQLAICCSCGACAWTFVRADSVPRRAVFAMTALVSLAVVPIAHWVLLVASAEEVTLFGFRLMHFFGLLLVGAGFYGSGLPERVLPGRFDVWGHSHTWWHVFVALAIGSFHSSLIDYSQWKEAHSCDQLPAQSAGNISTYVVAS